MDAKNLVRNAAKKLFLRTKIQLQIIASFSASNMINRFGTYPIILDFAISKNYFKISKYREYSGFEIEDKVIEIMRNVDAYRKDGMSKKKNDLEPGPRTERPKIAFLVSGSINSITNNILANIADSYDGNVTLTLNQSLDSDGSLTQIPIDTCFELLKNFSPKIIFFELHTSINGDSDGLVLSKNFVSRVKRELGCEIYIICFDIWREFDVEYLKYWSDLADRFIHFDEYSAKKLDKEFPMYNWLYPALNKFQWENKIKDTGLFFQGSIREYDRRKILVYAGKICHKIGISYEFNTFVHHTYRKIPMRDEYLRALSRAQYCLSVSQKAIDHWLVTFRAIEAINAGVIPIQQAGAHHDPLSVYYSPYLHYLPFDSPLALAANIYIIKNHKEVTDFITEQLHVFHEANYGSVKLWNNLLQNQKPELR